MQRKGKNSSLTKFYVRKDKAAVIFLNQSHDWESCTRAGCSFTQNIEHVVTSDLTNVSYVVITKK